MAPLLVFPYLVPIDQTGSNEIDSCEYPQHRVGMAHVINTGPGRIHAHKAFDTPRRRDDGSQPLPILGHGVARPGDTRNEEEDDRGEDKEQERALALTHKDREGHAEEYRREQEGHGKRVDLDLTAYLRELEQPGNEVQDVGRTQDIQTEVTQGLTDNQVQHVVVHVLAAAVKEV